jgi:hypothetical protein
MGFSPPSTSGGGSSGLQGGGSSGLQGGGSSGSIWNPLGDRSLQQVFANILQFIATVAVPIVVFMIVYAGFKLVMAQGNSEELKSAKKMIMYVIIGGLIILGANILANVVRNTVNNISGGVSSLPSAHSASVFHNKV